MTQVVTDTAINLKTEKRVLETLVDSTYKAKSGALNKARALQFCLEEDKNILKLTRPFLSTSRAVKISFALALILYFLQSLSGSFLITSATLASAGMTDFKILPPSLPSHPP